MKPFINKYKFCLVIASLLFGSLSGCKKVLDVSLQNSSPQIVITGEVNNLPGPYTVTISKSVNFSANNDFPAVSGAFVSIHGNGVTDTLSEIFPGTYATHDLKGRPGHRYSLIVSLEGQKFTASSVMPQPVELDSLDFMLGRDNNIFAVAHFKDPIGVPNYYQFIEYANGKKLSNGRGNSVFDDRLSDGRYISRLLYDDSTDLKSKDTLTVQMNCVDKPVYDYLNQLFQISGGGNRGFSSPTPANPTSNITGGALGYFSANTVTHRKALVP